MSAVVFFFGAMLAGDAWAADTRSSGASAIVLAEASSAPGDATAREVCTHRFGFRGHRRLILQPRVCRAVGEGAVAAAPFQAASAPAELTCERRRYGFRQRRVAARLCRIEPLAADSDAPVDVFVAN